MFCTQEIIKVLVKFPRKFFPESKTEASLVDWIVANMLAVRQGSLGHIRYVIKNDLKWIPLYGFYFQQVKIKIK